MRKLTFVFSLIIVLTVSSHNSAFAFPHGKHDEYLELLFFGGDQPEIHQEVIDLLEKASYLTIDQFNKGGQSELTTLSNAVGGVPKEIASINFTANSITHRYFTHKGWDFDYQLSHNEDPAHWSIRRRILLLTVNKVFDFGPLSGSLFGYDNFDERCISLSALIYNVHIIGDHIYDNSYKNNPQIPLYRPNDEKNPGIIPEVIKHCKILFGNTPGNENVYGDFMNELKQIQNRVEPLVNSTGGVDSQDEFTVYHKCAEDLMVLLTDNVPILLKNENFFLKVFFPSRVMD